jgi:hypothetical protein
MLHRFKSTSHNEMITFYHQVFLSGSLNMLHLFDESRPNIKGCSNLYCGKLP